MYSLQDCDDQDPSIYPGAVDTCYDNIDSDCMRDSDWDCYQDGQEAIRTVVDCDDSDPAVFFGAIDIWYDGIDWNCDGASDYDQDGDGYDTTAAGGLDQKISFLTSIPGFLWTIAEVEMKIVMVI